MGISYNGELTLRIAVYHGTEYRELELPFDIPKNREIRVSDFFNKKVRITIELLDA